MSVSLNAQELPPIGTYSLTDYGGENQNWMISQTSDNFIYFANNEGLLEFNGASWRLYPSPNRTIIRSVYVQNNRIYTGSFREFGFWEKNSIGDLDYKSLSQILSTKLLEDEHFWGIVNHNEWMLFQSAKRIYLYNLQNEAFMVIETESEILKIATVNNAVYYYVLNEGLFTIVEGNPVQVINSTEIKNDRVINFFPFEKDLLILTRKSGFYKLQQNKIVKWSISAEDILKNVTVYCGIQLKEKGFILGTISDGMIILTDVGIVRYHINKSNGLNNNTVLSLFEDKDKNIWAGLDNGINYINLDSPIRIFNDSKGEIGTVYSSVVFEEYLYLGTNQGLFYKKYESTEPHNFIENTSGQVWSLNVINGELFCGHHSGTFLIKKGRAAKIASIPGAWNIRPIPGKPNVLLQGNYTGLYILSKETGTWLLRNKINGFDNSARFFEIDVNNDIWINHEYMGVYYIQVDENFEEITQVSLNTNFPEGRNSGLVLNKSSILYFFKDGIFRFDFDEQRFVKDIVFSQILDDDEYISGKLVIDNSNNLWGFTKNNIVYFSLGHLTEHPQMKRIPIPNSLRKTKAGYENITQLKNESYLLGTVDGYITLNLSKFIEKEYRIFLNSVVQRSIKNENFPVDLNHKGNFSSKQNRIVFSFSVPQYDKFNKTEYQYQLTGFYNKWSAWTIENIVVFENLPPGSYIFKVRARVGNNLSQNEEYYSFVINKPWFLTNLAISGYSIVVLFIFFLSFKIYNHNYLKKYRRELELSQLENQKQILLIKNQQLNQDIENKNRELSISTMSIIKKNELLGDIKKELKKVTDGLNLKSLISLVDKNINTTKDWQIFEEAFNNADKDFLQKVKRLHPDLTPNDLKICAYLRLNLSSKEIAPLLNISVRSVEIKRYRLRKKLNLPHNDSLTSYILKI